MNEKSAFLTMDIDWAHDEVTEYALDLFTEHQLPVTIFITHNSPILKRLKQNPYVQLGIHPNFYPQLNGMTNQNFTQTIDALLELVPNARYARSHGLIDGTSILLAFQQRGIQFDSNLFIPHSAGLPLHPFTHFSGLTRLPYFYEDDAYCFEKNPASPEVHLCAVGLKIFNFHPIHLFLNTETMERYNAAKPYQQYPAQLREWVNPDPTNGAEIFLRALAENAARHKIQWKFLGEAI